MRKHMEIFHYVAHELKDVPLFEVNQSKEDNEKVGAIYKDYNNEAPFEEHNVQYSYTSDIVDGNMASVTICNKDLDHPILKANKENSVFQAPHHNLVVLCRLADLGG